MMTRKVLRVSVCVRNEWVSLTKLIHSQTQNESLLPTEDECVSIKSVTYQNTCVSFNESSVASHSC